MIDITKDPDFDGIYNEDMNEDPTYNPNSPEEKAVFMKYAEYILLKMTFSTTQVQQCENVFIFMHCIIEIDIIEIVKIIN